MPMLTSTAEEIDRIVAVLVDAIDAVVTGNAVPGGAPA